MMLKQIGLVALAATFIAGSAASAYAESNISGADESETTSASLRNDWAWDYGAAMSLPAPSAGVETHGYTTDRRLDRSHRHVPINHGMN
jgi:hypothetical protein